MSMTFEQALDNPETRAIIDSIDDTMSSLRHKPHDNILADALRHQQRQLKDATGLDYGEDRMTTTVYGHPAECRVLKRHGMGTYDLDVKRCPTMPSMVGKCYRVTGMPMA